MWKPAWPEAWLQWCTTAGVDVAVFKSTVLLQFNHLPSKFARRAGKGSKPHLLRWPWSKAPEHLSCEDPAVRDKYRCEARVFAEKTLERELLLHDSCLMLLAGAQHRQSRLASAVGAVVGALPHKTPEDLVPGARRLEA